MLMEEQEFIKNMATKRQQLSLTLIIFFIKTHDKGLITVIENNIKKTAFSQKNQSGNSFSFKNDLK